MAMADLAQQAPQPQEASRLLNLSEAAAALSISRTSLYKLLDSNAIRSVKIGASRRVPVAALNQFVEQLEAESGHRGTAQR